MRKSQYLGVEDKGPLLKTRWNETILSRTEGKGIMLTRSDSNP